MSLYGILYLILIETENYVPAAFMKSAFNIPSNSQFELLFFARSRLLHNGYDFKGMYSLMRNLLFYIIVQFKVKFLLGLSFPWLIVFRSGLP